MRRPDGEASSPPHLSHKSSRATFWLIGATDCESNWTSQGQRDQVIDFVIPGFVLRDPVLGIHLSF
jgi:hypothetical protein